MTVDEVKEKGLEYLAITDKVKELTDALKEAKEQKEALETAICDALVDNELPNIVVDGFNLSLQAGTYYSKLSEEKLAEKGLVFFDILRNEGLGDIIVEKVDPRTLNSACKNYVEEQGELPEDLLNCLSVFEKLSLSKRKANMKALDKAKKAKE